MLSALADAGYAQACLVIGPEHGVVRAHYERAGRRAGSRSPSRSRRSRSEPPTLCSRRRPGRSGEPFLVVNSDNYYPLSALEGLRGLAGPGAALFERETLVAESGLDADRVRAYALCRVGPDGYLAGIVEKPDAAALAQRARARSSA